MIGHNVFLPCCYKTVRSLTTSLFRRLVLVCTGPFSCPIHAHLVMVGICVDLKRLDNLGSTPVSEKQLKATIPFLLQLKVLYELSF